MRRAAIGIAVVLAGLAGPAPGVGEAGPVEIGVGGGFSLPVDDLDEAFDSGFHVKGILNFKPPAFPLGLRAALGYQEFDATQSVTVEEATTKMASALGGLSFDVLSLGPVTPYLTASLGVYRFRTEIPSGSDASDVSQTTFGVDAGAGVKLRLGAVKAFVEGRVENAFTSEGLGPVLQDPDNLQAVPITFGVFF